MTINKKPAVSFRVLYAAAFGVWLLLTAIAFAYVVRDSIGQVEAEFRRHTEMTVAELRDKLKANEAVLAGFTSFLSAVEASDRDSVRHYASSMLASYPHIYMLEVARKVEQRDRIRFERHMQRSWDTSFQIRDFAYESSRNWTAAIDKASYQPIVFIWPEYEEAKPVLGLDMDSVPHLRNAIAESRLRRTAFSSSPFTLVEGSNAYVMFRPAERSASQSAASPEHSFAGPLSAMLVIKATALLPSVSAPHTAQRLQIARNGTVLEPALYDLAAEHQASALERHFFPILRLQTGDYSTSQPMQLTVERQVRFADLSAEGIKLMTVLSILMLSLLAAYLRRHHHDLEHAKELEARSEYLALHDPLTALPNRNLLEDRVRQSLAAWRRRGTRFGLLFLDLDKFKEVNDSHGHEVGDRLLNAIARRLEGAVRESDTVARYGGDEFVIVVSGIGDDGDIAALSAKILDAVARPFELGRITLHITTSLGISLCPQDGDDFDTLLNRADTAMYGIKRSGRNGIGRSEPRPQADEAADETLESQAKVRLIS